MNSNIKTILTFRPHDWLNTETMTTEYGVQANMGGRWMHCHSDGKVTFFDTVAERAAWINKHQGMTPEEFRDAKKKDQSK